MSQEFKYQNLNLTVPHGKNFDISVGEYWDGSLAYVIMSKPSITHEIRFFLDSLNVDSKRVNLYLWLKKVGGNEFVVDSVGSRIHREADGDWWYEPAPELENKLCHFLREIHISLLYDPLSLYRFQVILAFFKED